jgi:hypothetical protein
MLAAIAATADFLPGLLLPRMKAHTAEDLRAPPYSHPPGRLSRLASFLQYSCRVFFQMNFDKTAHFTPVAPHISRLIIRFS